MEMGSVHPKGMLIAKRLYGDLQDGLNLIPQNIDLKRNFGELQFDIDLYFPKI